MLDLLSTQNTLHTRLIDFSLQEYLFVVQVVLGERLEVAYANTFDTTEFKRNIPSEDEEDYLAQFKHDAEILLEQQQCAHLKSYLEEEYQREVQAKASTLEDFKFTGADVQRLLANLLHNRSESLDDASVKDILSLIKSMYESGALDSDDSFQRHFITIPKKYDAMCPNCGHELYAIEGLDIKCQHCSQVYKWVDNRFYPQLQKL